ncbi:MAG: radical SAM protein [Deltaproteobacteria bacterium]|jgi:radical SAM protein with 4Fe4S-binding SPASM domain|nr:radical SAM protein [Deltaproteobacteria bacterium]MBW2533755.1 radical SAM protein [Deltaproteobacteria bacterium]
MLKLLKKLGYAPRICVWELTLACNLNCRHCGSRAGKSRPDELTTPEALELVAALARLRCRTVTIGGGEPLLRKDWPIIATAFIDKGVRVNMVTNGRTWSPQTTSLAKKIGMESVAFSIDGMEETHTYVRRVKGHYQHLLDCIDDCRAKGLTVSVITMVHRRNLNELDQLRKLLADRGVDRWQLQLGNPMGYMADHAEMCLQPEDVLQVVPKIAELCRLRGKPKIYPGHNVGYYGDPEEELRDTGGAIPFWVGCTAGCSVIGIESNGNVKGCLSLPSAMNDVDAFVEGNIRETPLEEIWRRRGAFAYNRQFSVEQLDPDGFCRSCDYAEICRGGCAWTAFAYTGSRYDNLYCYWRQLQLAEQKGDGESSVGD